MGNLDRLLSAFSARIKSTVDRAMPHLRTARARAATNPTVKTVGDAVSPRLRVVGDALSRRMKAVRAASPKVKTVWAAIALSGLTGITVPIAATEAGHNAYAADNVATSASQAPTYDQLHPTGIQGLQSDL